MLSCSGSSCVCTTIYLTVRLLISTPLIYRILCSTWMIFGRGNKCSWWNKTFARVDSDASRSGLTILRLAGPGVTPSDWFAWYQATSTCTPRNKNPIPRRRDNMAQMTSDLEASKIVSIPQSSISYFVMLESGPVTRLLHDFGSSSAPPGRLRSCTIMAGDIGADRATVEGAGVFIGSAGG